MDTGIGKSACGIGEVFRVAFCRDDQNRFCINDRNEVLEARHVLLVERNDGGKVDHAALAIFAGGAQHVEQVIGGACHADLVLFQFQIGGKLCAAGCGVEIGRDRQDARVGDGGAARQLCGGGGASMSRRADQQDVPARARGDGVAANHRIEASGHDIGRV